MQGVRRRPTPGAPAPKVRVAPRYTAGPIFAGGYCAGDTPVPISNTAVKPCRADGTAEGTRWESTSPPAYMLARTSVLGVRACVCTGLFRRRRRTLPALGRHSAAQASCWPSDTTAFMLLVGASSAGARRPSMADDTRCPRFGSSRRLWNPQNGRYSRVWSSAYILPRSAPGESGADYPREHRRSGRGPFRARHHPSRATGVAERR